MSIDWGASGGHTGEANLRSSWQFYQYGIPPYTCILQRQLPPAPVLIACLPTKTPLYRQGREQCQRRRLAICLATSMPRPTTATALAGLCLRFSSKTSGCLANKALPQVRFKKSTGTACRNFRGRDRILASCLKLEASYPAVLRPLSFEWPRGFGRTFGWASARTQNHCTASDLGEAGLEQCQLSHQREVKSSFFYVSPCLKTVAGAFQH